MEDKEFFNTLEEAEASTTPSRTWTDSVNLTYTDIFKLLLGKVLSASNGGEGVYITVNNAKNED